MEVYIYPSSRQANACYVIARSVGLVYMNSDGALHRVISNIDTCSDITTGTIGVYAWRQTT